MIPNHLANHLAKYLANHLANHLAKYLAKWLAIPLVENDISENRKSNMQFYKLDTVCCDLSVIKLRIINNKLRFYAIEMNKILLRLDVRYLEHITNSIKIMSL